MVLKVISAENILFEGEVEKVSLPGAGGTFVVLPHHASLISTLVKGTVSYEHNGHKGEVSVDGGIVDVDNDVVSVCIY
ncbi:F0F1 ATP synthase subunit epsilon [Barnesiella sp. WM24]|uniref:F0F1 ATP synthase subunit epsilon n=1 Tax=Barnesiella sp. WM24 TaxID=2558278 RepID=UPI001072D710|nr:F0F1 ATP synthase subunit epsilon [Barnesiella sp. WM24]TFU94858.1 F0F1 ATP synthase subunit epsilon [Barnesiella sp. WM24]